MCFLCTFNTLKSYFILRTIYEIFGHLDELRQALKLLFFTKIIQFMIIRFYNILADEHVHLYKELYK